MDVRGNRWPGWVCSWCLLLALAIIGCKGAGPPKGVSAVLKGKLTKGGQPFSAGAVSSSYARVEVRLVPAAGGTFYSANVGADGTFQIATLDGAGLPPGKYRVAVFKWNAMGNQDELNGKFNEANTPLSREIAGNEQLLEIDLDKP